MTIRSLRSEAEFWGVSHVDSALANRSGNMEPLTQNRFNELVLLANGSSFSLPHSNLDGLFAVKVRLEYAA